MAAARRIAEERQPARIVTTLLDVIVDQLAVTTVCFCVAGAEQAPLELVEARGLSDAAAARLRSVVLDDRTLAGRAARSGTFQALDLALDALAAGADSQDLRAIDAAGLGWA